MTEENSFIPYGRQSIDADDIRAVVNVLESDWLTQGPKVMQFERAFAKYTQARFAVAVNSGTAGLHLACLAAGLGHGDTVATSPITFAATANCALYVGAKPVFVDICPDTYNICPKALEKYLQEHGPCKAVIPVHFAGLPCDMAKISRIAKKNNMLVIEDACHALGASYMDRQTGGWVKTGACRHSDMTVFSFHPVKNMTTGEGGMVTTDNENLYERLMLFRNHGVTKNPELFQNLEKKEKTANQFVPGYYEMQELGFNFRIPDIGCALGISQLKKLDRFVVARKKLAARYRANLARCNCVTLPAKNKDFRSSYHLFAVRINFARLGFEREQVMKSLADKGIGTQVHYIPVSAHPYYRRLGYDPAHCPEAMQFYAQCLSLPMFAALDFLQVDHVCEVLLEILTAP